MWKDIFVTITQLIVASPKAWKAIDKEKRDHEEFLSCFLHPLFGIIALASFVGGMWVTRDGNIENALKQVIINVVAVYGGYFIASYVLNEWAPRFELKKDMPLFQQFVGYSSVVLYLLYIIIPFFPDFIILWLFSLYTIHLVHTGAQYFVKVREEKRINFSLFASALIILVPAAIRLLFSILIK